MRMLIIVAAGLGSVVAASAQSQVDRTARAEVRTADQAMPGDYFDIPQSAQVKVPLGPPSGPNTRPPRPSQAEIPSPGADLAAEAAGAALKSCAADRFTVAVAVTDSAGNLKAAIAPDGTRSNGVYMAMHKAVTVVGFKMSTLQLRQRIEKDPSLMASVRPNMSLLPGGLPIFRGKQLVGAIAVSGAAAYEEEKCARAGIARIEARL